MVKNFQSKPRENTLINLGIFQQIHFLGSTVSIAAPGRSMTSHRGGSWGGFISHIPSQKSSWMPKRILQAIILQPAVYAGLQWPGTTSLGNSGDLHNTSERPQLLSRAGENDHILEGIAAQSWASNQPFRYELSICCCVEKNKLSDHNQQKQLPLMTAIVKIWPQSIILSGTQWKAIWGAPG